MRRRGFVAPEATTPGLAMAREPVAIERCGDREWRPQWRLSGHVPATSWTAGCGHCGSQADGDVVAAPAAPALW